MESRRRAAFSTVSASAMTKDWPVGCHDLVAERAWAEEIPLVAGDVEKDRDATIWLGAGFPDEGDPGLDHPPVHGLEVVDAEEEPDAAGYLTTHRGALAFPIGAGDQDSRLGARRPDNNPPLGAPVVGQRWRVLHQVEAEHLGEERDGRVVLVNDQGNQIDLHDSRLDETISIRCKAAVVRSALTTGRSRGG